MIDHPSISTPAGAAVQITIPPGWFIYISGLSRQAYSQFMRLRLSSADHPVHMRKLPGDSSDILKDTDEGSYTIFPSKHKAVLDVAFLYSKKGADAEDAEFANSLIVNMAQTPPHLSDDFPDYVTYCVYVQDSSPHNETSVEFSPSHNDAIGLINLVKGTGRDTSGKPLRSFSYSHEVPDARKNDAKPSFDDPIGPCVKMHIPPGWDVFVAGLSRASYNHTIKISYTLCDNTNTDFISSTSSADDIMRLTRTKEGYFVLSSEDEDVDLNLTFYASTNVAKSGVALAKAAEGDKNKSKAIRVVQTHTPVSKLHKGFPDYTSYFVLVQDTHKTTTDGEYPDVVCVVNLIKDTPQLKYSDVDLEEEQDD